MRPTITVRPGRVALWLDDVKLAGGGPPGSGLVPTLEEFTVKQSRFAAVSLCIALAGLAGRAVAQAQPTPEEIQKILAEKAAKLKGEGGAAQPAMPSKPGPYTPTITTTDGRVTFSETEHDFGTISDDAVQEAEFKFTNSGTGPLEITNTQGSCGCTIGSLEKRVYQPGEGGSIKVSFNPAHKRDQQHTTVTVSSNDSTKPQTVLNIKSFVRPLVMIEPSVAMLNQMPKGKGGSTKVTISSRIPGLKILAATPTVGYFDAKVGEERQVEVNGEKLTQWDMDIIARPDAPVGAVNGGVNIRTSDEKRLLSITATGEIVGDILLSPPRIQLSGLAPGQAINAQFQIKSRNGAPFTVSRVDDAPSGSKTFANIELKEDASTTPHSYTVILTGTASEQGGQISGQLIVRTNIKGEEETKVPYFGYVRAPAKPQPGDAPAKPAKAPTVWDDNPSTLVPQPGPR